MKRPSIKKRYTAKGFTLIEALVYIFVLVMVSGAAVMTYLSLDTVLMRNRAERMLTHDAVTVLERMVRDIREAENVEVGLSTFGSSPGTLTLDQSGTTTAFFLANGKIVVSVNGAELGPLTSDGVTVENLTFVRYTNSDTELVRVALTLSVSNKAASSTRTFYGSATPRGSYE